MTRAERLTIDAERALLARLEAEEHAGWGTVTPTRTAALRRPTRPPRPADIANLRRILQLLTVVMRDDENRHRSLLAHNAWTVWARTGQPKRAA